MARSFASTPRPFFASAINSTLRSYETPPAALVARGRIAVRRIHRVGLGAQVRQHVVSPPRLTFVTHGGDVDRRDDDPLAGPGRGFGEQAAVEVDDLTAARPRVRRIVPQAGALVGGDDVSGVLERAAAVHERPPVHRFGRAPRIHVGGHAHQDFGAVRGQLADALRETASRNRSRSRGGRWAYRPRERAARRSPRDRAGWRGLRTGIHGIHLAILVEDALRARSGRSC